MVHMVGLEGLLGCLAICCSIPSLSISCGRKVGIQPRHVQQFNLLTAASLPPLSPLFNNSGRNTYPSPSMRVKTKFLSVLYRFRKNSRVQRRIITSVFLIALALCASFAFNSAVRLFSSSFSCLSNLIAAVMLKVWNL
jgi:hypothetical protein